MRDEILKKAGNIVCLITLLLSIACLADCYMGTETKTYIVSDWKLLEKKTKYKSRRTGKVIVSSDRYYYYYSDDTKLAENNFKRIHFEIGDTFLLTTSTIFKVQYQVTELKDYTTTPASFNLYVRGGFFLLLPFFSSIAGIKAEYYAAKFLAAAFATLVLGIGLIPAFIA